MSKNDVTVGDLFTDEQIDAAYEIVLRLGDKEHLVKLADVVLREVVRDGKLAAKHKGAWEDEYLSYVILHAIGEGFLHPAFGGPKLDKDVTRAFRVMELLERAERAK